jgi:hypothetical protein
VAAMSEFRDYSLPKGMSDLGEFVQYQQAQNTSEYNSFFFGSTTLRLRGWECGAIFNKLSRRIDQDLLFTEYEELLLPRMLEVVVEQLNFVFGELNLEVPADLKDRMIKAMLTSVSMEISRHRPTYLLRQQSP